MRPSIAMGREVAVNRACLFGLLIISGQFVCAGEADVLTADVNCNSESICSFSVSVRHDDKGWEHYANRWEILDTDGNVIGVRELAHPHDNEQPFTRSLSNVKVTGDITEVVIRAHDSVHQYGGKELVVRIRK
jgi:hypothetical protein